MIERIAKIVFCASLSTMWWVTCALEGNAITIAQAVAVLAVAMPTAAVSACWTGWGDWPWAELVLEFLADWEVSEDDVR